MGQMVKVSRSFLVVAILAFGNPGWAFDLTSKVGAGRDATDGVRWWCVIEDTTHIRCGFDDGTSTTWCNEYTLPNDSNANPYSTVSPHGAIYLVQDFPSQNGKLEVALLAVHSASSTSYAILIMPLVDPGSIPTCIYPPTAVQFEYMTGQSHPDFGPQLGVTDADSNNNIFVFAVTTDAFSAGSLAGVRIGANGTGGITSLYSYGVEGLVDTHVLDPGPIAAKISSLTGLPLVAVRNVVSGTKRMSAVFEDSMSNWNFLQGALLANATDAGASFDIANMAAHTLGATRYGDSLFTVGTNGNLYEDKFDCSAGVGGCGNPPGYALKGVFGESNNGSSLDSTTFSVAASWCDDGTTEWAFAYTHEAASDTQADTDETDRVTGSGDTWSTYVPGSSGWPSMGLFKGEQTLVRVPISGSTRDEVYGACEDHNGNPNVCRMNRSCTSLSTYAWTWYLEP